MSTSDLFNLLDQVVYLSIFVLVAVRAVRRPIRPNLDVAAFFGTIAAILVLQQAFQLTGLDGQPSTGAVTFLIVNALPYTILRLVDDFAEPPRWLLYGAVAYLALLVGLTLTVGVPIPPWILIMAAAWFAATGGYAIAAFIQQARIGSGVTRRRMYAVTAGFVLVVAAVVISFLGAVLPAAAELTRTAAQGIGLVAGLAFFVGFVPPVWLRRMWQEPELHAFLMRAARLRTSDRLQAVRALETDAARALGAEGASIGLYEAERDALAYRQPDGVVVEFGADQLIGGRAYTSQRPVASLDAIRDDPEHAALYRHFGANAVLAAPVTSGDRRWGVLGVFAARPSIFVEDDVRLVQFMADQVALVLEGQELIDEKARLRAREEAAQLKEDFLAAAAHDLRTPITVLLAQSELLERQASRNPGAPVAADGLARITREAKRLRDLVHALLDTHRLHEGGTIVERERVDLRELLTAAAARAKQRGGVVREIAPEAPLFVSADRARLDQLLDNLLENARKYSAPTAPVELRASMTGQDALIEIVDQGIGIPPADLPHIFDRFYRASNLDDPRTMGMGLGLYICRTIVDEHDGRLWATSEEGRGSTFHVTLPLATPEVAAQPVEAEPLERRSVDVPQPAGPTTVADAAEAAADA